MVKMLQGYARVLLDTDTGLIVSMSTDQLMQNSRSTYESDTSYVLKRMNHGAAIDASLFNLPSKDTREVKAEPPIAPVRRPARPNGHC
jgi:hypothetical protein